MKKNSRKYARNEGGNIAVITALGLTVLTGVSGLAVIYLQGFQQKTGLQAALDSGVLAGTALGYSASDKMRVSAAEAAFYANSKHGGIFGERSAADFIAEGMPKPTFTVMKAAVSGAAYARIENSLGAAVGISSLDVEVKARATKRDSTPLCLLTLGESAPKSLYVYGNASLSADCAIQANSTDSSAIEVAGTRSSLSASMIGVTGGSSGTAINPSPIRGTVPVDDPYASLPVPETGACLMTGATIKTSQSLSPGTYCGGLTIKTGATATLKPGIFVIKDGQFRIDSGGRVEGHEVLIALVGDDSYIYMGSDSSAKLTSPVDGIYKNIQFMSDRDLSGSKFEEEWSTILSGATLEFDGVMYLPEQKFWVSGTAHEAVVKAYSPAYAMVVDTAYIQGNAVVEVKQMDRRHIGEVSGRVGFGYGAKLVK